LALFPAKRFGNELVIIFKDNIFRPVGRCLGHPNSISLKDVHHLAHLREMRDSRRLQP